MKKKVRYISLAFILLWIIGVAYRIWSAQQVTGSVTMATYTVFDAITDGSLVIGVIGLVVSVFIKKPAEKTNK